MEQVAQNQGLTILMKFGKEKKSKEFTIWIDVHEKPSILCWSGKERF